MSDFKTPNVTIVLPVYNAEPYLRQCLDSVINQTMWEIQIICVNDGSTDGSPAILEEYAAKDPRILIIHQENQGGGSARNTAFPHIKGKYTYFVDPDDWIDLQLCEKLFKCAEESQAEMVYLNFRCIFQTKFSHQIEPRHLLSNKDLPLEERKKVFFRITGTWRKFWSSHFLLTNQITFVAGKRPNNDVLQNWKGVCFAERIEVLDEKLYFYRIHGNSYQTNIGNNFNFSVLQTYDEVREFLINSGYYDRYKETFLALKLRRVFVFYSNSSLRVREKLFEKAVMNFNEEERVFCQKLSRFNCEYFFCRAVFAKKMQHKLQYIFFSVILLLCVYLYLFGLKIHKLLRS